MATLEERVDDLERRLRLKLESDTGFADKTTQAVKLESVFRRFDKDGSGTIGFSEFSAAMVGFNFVGVQREVKALFERYDEDGSGHLSYGEFSGALYGLLPNLVGDAASRSATERFRRKIAERGGLVGIRTLGRILRQMDDNGNGKLDREELKWGCKAYKLGMSDRDLDMLMKAFDRDGDGQINFDEFLRGIRGGLNKRRRGLILMAFGVLDKDGSGVVTLDEVAKIYDTSKHPNVIDGSKTEEEVIKEFTRQWDRSDFDGNITQDEFLDYYKDVSASIDDDDYFELMIRNAWHLSGGEGQFECTTTTRVLATYADGRQEVIEVKDDLGLDRRHPEQFLKALHAAGGYDDVIEVSL